MFDIYIPSSRRSLFNSSQ